MVSNSTPSGQQYKTEAQKMRCKFTFDFSKFTSEFHL